MSTGTGGPLPGGGGPPSPFRDTLLTPRPFLRVWRPGASGQVELVLAQQGRYGGPVHAHEELELSLAPLHPRTLEVGGRSFAVPAAAVSAVMPGETHRTRVREGAGLFYSVRIHPGVVREVWEGLGAGGDHPPRLPVVLPDARLARALLRLHRLAGHGPGLDALALETRLRDLLTLLFRSAGAGVGDRAPLLQAPSGVAAARAWMEDAPGDAFSLTQLAGRAGLSPAHFSRVFRAATGLSPHAYLLDARVRRAKVLLGGGEALAQVALGLGFSSQSHFAHAFGRRVGVSPVQFRQDSRILVDRERLWGASSGHDEP